MRWGHGKGDGEGDWGHERQRVGNEEVIEVGGHEEGGEDPCNQETISVHMYMYRLVHVPVFS